jgi:hypothetical protein
MEQQNPEFEVPPANMRLLKEELEVLLPTPESIEEPTFREVRSEYIAVAAVKERTSRQPAKKQAQTRPK